MVAYRNLATSGGGVTPGTNGPVDLGTYFRLNMFDLDYNSRELSLWPQWDMKWSVGLRNLFINWAAQGTQPFTQAPAGGVFQARQFNNTYGIGPHWALQLDRFLGDSGWSLMTRFDVAGTFAYISEGWLAKSGGSARPACRRSAGHTRSATNSRRGSTTGWGSTGSRRQTAEQNYSSATSTTSSGTWTGLFRANPADIPRPTSANSGIKGSSFKHVSTPIFSAGGMGLMHGTNDAQKTMGIIALVLCAATGAGTSTACPTGFPSCASFRSRGNGPSRSGSK